MNLETILEEWKEDAKVNESNLIESTLKFASMHAKYLEIWTLAKLKLSRFKKEDKVLLKEKWRYFSGKMTQREMDERGWAYDPFEGGVKPIKSEMSYFYDADVELNNSKMKIEYQDATVQATKEILDTIRWRHSVVKNMIESKKFEAGM